MEVRSVRREARRDSVPGWVDKQAPHRQGKRNVRRPPWYLPQNFKLLLSVVESQTVIMETLMDIRRDLAALKREDLQATREKGA